jgi:hypothetical protein
MTKVAIASGDYAGLHKDVVSVVESVRRTAARNVNAVMTAAYWEIGRRIVASEQGGQWPPGYRSNVLQHISATCGQRSSAYWRRWPTTTRDVRCATPPRN